MKVDNRFALLLVMLGIFCGWLAMISFWFMPLMTSSELLDPMMTLVAGFGIGSVTGSFIILITLSWNFYFRKKEET